MRINKYLASNTSLSRRAADSAILDGRVMLNDKKAEIGDQIGPNDVVTLDGKKIEPNTHKRLVKLNKPIGYVCSRTGQGSSTVFELLPEELKKLQTVGRLDKNSTGLILLTNDGTLAQSLTHPSNNKQKVYLVDLDKPLTDDQRRQIGGTGVELEDGNSKLQLLSIGNNLRRWQVTMTEGRNRQIRRTFEAVDCKVIGLHRIKFGQFELSDLPSGHFEEITFQ